METRRNRLRCLAFRRGLLEPDYKYGVQSKARESLVLRLLEHESEANKLLEEIFVKEIALAPYLDRKQVIDHTNKLRDVIDWAHKFKLAYQKPFMTHEQKLEQSSGGLINVWNKMAKSGKLAEIQDKMHKIYEAYTNQEES